MTDRKNLTGRYGTVLPYITIKNADAAIKFYEKLFGAKELYRLEDKGLIVHAEIQIGTNIIMIMDEMPGWGARGATTIGDSAVSFYVYVDNVDAVFANAIAMGSKVDYPVENAFYGDRMGSFTDPFGQKWAVAKHIEDVSNEEIMKRYKKMAEKMGQSGGKNHDDEIYKEKYLKYKKKYLHLKSLH